MLKGQYSLALDTGLCTPSQGARENPMTAEWRLTEGFSANILGTHDSEGHWLAHEAKGARYPSNSGITFPQWA